MSAATRAADGASGMAQCVRGAFGLAALGTLVACGVQEPTEPRSWAQDAWRVGPLQPVVSDYDPDRIAEIPFIPLLTTDEPTDEHVVRVAEVFVDIFNYAVATGDHSHLDRSCHPQNRFCFRIVGNAERRAEHATRMEGGQVSVDSAHLVGFDEIRDIWTVGMTHAQEPMTYHYADGETDTFDGSEGDLHVEITHWPSRGWLLREISSAEEGD